METRIQLPFADIFSITFFVGSIQSLHANEIELKFDAVDSIEKNKGSVSAEAAYVSGNEMRPRYITNSEGAKSDFPMHAQ